MLPASYEAPKQHPPSPSIPVDSAVELAWTVHLLKQRPKSAVRIGICLAVTYVCGALVFHDLLLSLLPCAAMLAAVSEYLFPVRYTLDASGAKSRWLVASLEIAWKDVKHAYLTEDGIKLSPLTRKGARMEALRGVYLRFDNNRDDVIEAVRTLRDRSHA